MNQGWMDRIQQSGAPLLVFLVGLLLATATARAAVDALSAVEAVETIFLGILAVAVFTRGITLRATDRTWQDQWRVAGWCLVGTLGASVLGGLVLVRAILHGDAVGHPIGLIETFAGLGAVAGLFVGGDQVRAITASRTTERKQTSELLEKREEERLTFLNHLLRHNVLNGMNIVLGYTAALDDALDAHDEYVERIRTRSEAVVDLVQNVQVLVRSLSGDLDVDAVNLTETARVQLQRARASHDATYHATLEPGVVVATTPFVSSAIENLLSNAAVHNDAPETEIVLRVERAGDHGLVSITDNGPGIPSDVIETYFGDRDPDDAFVGDGLGLYLVDELVTTHGGTVTVTNNEPRGATVTLEFPLTTDQAVAADEPGTAATA